MASEYSTWFHKIAGFAPHSWQAELGDQTTCEHRLIRIPTGFGKTAGVVLAWLYHRVVRGDDQWPRRLVFTLPMRVLVEQTEAHMREWLRQAGLDAGDRRVDVHVLMGGVRTEPWVNHPDRPAILLGTQDMLLSRALNRGYGAARGRWPREFGLLNHDALWVMDEVQLMDAGLITSAQLAAFRDHDAARTDRPWFRPVRTWWMSATLQPDWLRSTDSAALIDSLAERVIRIPAPARTGGLWDVRKPAERRADIASAADIAGLAAERHAKLPQGDRPKLTLVIVNRVDRAVATFDALVQAWSEGKGKSRRLRPDAPDLRLVHSRFRGHERRGWDFLAREASMPEGGRVIVSTQVIEAGVDISADLLITELAPWSSLVQRAGRAARDRDSERASVIVVGPVPGSDKDALPYDRKSLAAADRGWQRLMDEPPARGPNGEPDASLLSLTAFEDALRGNDPEFLQNLYPYAPAHVVQRGDVEDLFDTTADLSGADLDVSGFIRTGQERDVSVVWRDLDGAPRRISRRELGTVTREELCPVPVSAARKWLDGRSEHPAYVFDYVDGAWVRADLDRLAPGTIVVVPCGIGGYDPQRGWEPKSKTPVPPAVADEPRPDDRSPDGFDARFDDAAAAQDDDSASIAAFKTIATHGRETAEIAAELCRALGIPEFYASELRLAARWHDAGKAHATFQKAITEEGREPGAPFAERGDLAKAPDDAWRRPPYPDRPGFRHELASTLALFELLYRINPDHPALLGPHRDLLRAANIEPVEPGEAERVPPDHPLAGELVELDARAFNRVAYLVCSHHGKVRCTWTSTPKDQDKGQGAIHGVIDGDELPDLALHAGSGTGAEKGEPARLPALTLRLCAAALGVSRRYGASWAERVADLRAHMGPFALAYLEAVLRAADFHASTLDNEDPLR